MIVRSRKEPLPTCKERNEKRPHSSPRASSKKMKPDPEIKPVMDHCLESYLGRISSAPSFDHQENPFSIRPEMRLRPTPTSTPIRISSALPFHQDPQSNPSSISTEIRRRPPSVPSFYQDVRANSPSIDPQ